LFRIAQSSVVLTVTCFVTLSAIGLAAVPQDRLAAARAAYIATEYEEALTILSGSDDGVTSDQTDVYRALCLLALGRMDDLDRVLRSLAARNPAFRMSPIDVTPRMIALFEDVRAKTLESLARRAYGDAKASFDAGRYDEAASGFDRALALLDTTPQPPKEGSTPAGDLRQVALGFRDLATREVARTAATANHETAVAPVAPSAKTLAPVPVAPPDALIQGVVHRYALAFSALDADAVVRVFPSENTGSLRYAFSKLKAQAIDTSNVAIAVDPNGQSATVTLTWVVEAIPKVGSAVRARRPTTLRMARTASGDWTIVERR
jgi:tetratricopeptide (TPR) repeat protein